MRKLRHLEWSRVFLEERKLPEGKRKFTVTEPLKYGAEINSGAETGRYLTVTGDKIEDQAIPFR